MNKDRIVFSLARGTGKTYHAIKMAEISGARIVCPTYHLAQSVGDAAKLYNRTIKTPIGIGALDIKDETCREDELLIFDDIDQCLCSLLGININSIIGITIATTDNEENSEDNKNKWKYPVYGALIAAAARGDISLNCKLAIKALLGGEEAIHPFFRDLEEKQNDADRQS